MTRTVYLNGRYLQADQAAIGIFDRGFLFGDAIYEVTAVVGGRLVDNALHLARLERSLGEIGIPMPVSRQEIEAIQTELIRCNGLTEGTVYLQISRGEAERDFLFPEGLTPGFLALTQKKNVLDTPAQRNGVAVDIQPDIRWARRDIKTVMLLSQVMAKRAAVAAGFNDVWLHEDGMITEGASTSAFIVSKQGAIVTRGNSHSILPGCTRSAVLKLCAETGLSFEERPIAVTEAQDAAEAFHTSASSMVTPVIRIGAVTLGDGRPGPVTRRLQEIYRSMLGVGSGAAHERAN